MNANEASQTKEVPASESVVLNTKEAAVYVGLAKGTLEKLRIYGGGPMFLKYPRAVRYLTEDLDSWRSQYRTASTSESEGVEPWRKLRGGGTYRRQ